jgi:PPM family protein phosphatase
VTGATFQAFSRTDKGRMREQNEDSLYAGTTVFAVADGMGGHAAGEVASATALEPLRALDRREFATAEDAQHALAEAIAEANLNVVAKATNEPELRGMGTTLTAVLVRDGRFHVAHVGDSRAYLIRGGEISQLTTDHTLVEQLVREGRLSRDQAATHPQRSVITRAIGVDREVEVDSLPPLEMQPGDQVLLCSDGLSGPVEDPDIAGILAAEPEGQGAADALVDAANRAGGPDNITVVLIRVERVGAGSADGQAAAGAIQVDGVDAAEYPPDMEATEDLRAARPAPDPERTKRILTRPDPRDQDWASQMGRYGDRQGADDAPSAKRRRRSRRWVAVLLAVVVLLGVLGGGGYLVLSRAYFVGDNRGAVSIFNGLPNEVAGVPLYWAIETTDVRTDDLPQFRQERVREGITVATLDQARQTVENLRATTEDPTEDLDAGTPPPAPGATPAPQPTPSP